jgi:Chaperone of endosialidase
MKNFTFLVFLFICQYAYSQGIGIGSSNPPHPSAALDVNSTSKGFLLPRMSSIQRAFIPSPMKGLQVFDNNTNTIWYYNGTAWQELTGGGSFSLPYSATASTDLNISLFSLKNTGSGRGVRAETGFGTAVTGVSTDGIGTIGVSDNNYGIKGESNTSIGILGLAYYEFGGYFKPGLSAQYKIAIGGLIYENVKAALHIKSSNTGWGQHIRLENFANDEYAEILHDEGGLKFRNFQNGESFIFRNAGNTTLATLSSIGELCLLGNVNCTSDIRLKRNITPLNASLSALSSLKGYHYYWKSAEYEKLQTGLIAQEVQAVFPELVNTGEDGMLSVNYIGLIPHLVEAVKELKKENDELRARMGKLENLIK